jgi:hypothetical protein
MTILAHPLALYALAAPSVQVGYHSRMPLAPAKALEAFWERTWLRGGARLLPAVQLQAFGDSDTRVRSTRLLRPIGMVETVETVEVSATRACAHYRVTESGLLFGGEDIAHTGLVEFIAEPSADECRLHWSVSFTPPEGQSRAFWQAFTEINIQIAAGDLVAHVRRRRPQLTFNTRLRLDARAADAWAAWRGSTWHRNVGLPLPPPIMLSAGMRLVLPGLLLEQVLGADEAALSYRYTILNPGFQVLYPVSEHAGLVRFLPLEGEDPTASGCMLEWTVRLRPMRFGEGLARWLTETVIAALASGLAAELSAGSRPRMGIKESDPPVPESTWATTDPGGRDS